MRVGEKMSGKNTVLIVEDEINSRRLLWRILKENDYIPLSAATGKEACSLVSSHLPDLVLLNMGLPDMDGTEVISYIRKWSNMPIIVLSSCTKEKRKVEALDLGADDYITKPFGTLELIARIRTALRHKRLSVEEDKKTQRSYSYRGLEIDFGRWLVSVDGAPIRLTQIEFKIISLLCRYSGKVITYDYLLKNIWGPYTKSDNKILRVNITNIRKKLEQNSKTPQYIFTESGVGYRMGENENEN